MTFCEFYVIIYPLNCENQIYIDSFAGMMLSLRKIAGKTDIPSSPRDKSILNFSTPDRFPKKCLGGSKLTASAKKFRELCSRNFFIQAAGLAYHHRAKRGVYHQGRQSALVSHHALACISLRLDDIQHFVLMICNSCGIDDIQGCALIYFQWCGIMLVKGGAI